MNGKGGWLVDWVFLCPLHCPMELGFVRMIYPTYVDEFLWHIVGKYITDKIMTNLLSQGVV